MEFKISQKLAQAILDYLVKQPYCEVAQLAIQLQQLQKLEEPKPVEGPKEA